MADIRYERPASVTDALTLLAQEPGRAVLLAGGTDLQVAVRGGLGLELLVDEPYRLPQLTSVGVPEAVDEAAFRRQLLERFGIEIGGGLGPLAGKIWRVGLMGETCREENVKLFLSALDELLEGKA